MSPKSERKTKTRKKIFGIAMGSFILVSAYFVTKQKNEVTVGDYILTEADIACRNAVIKTSFPDENRNLGLNQLVKSYQHVQILKNHGYEITPDKIKAEKERIDRASLMPEKLVRIKSACGGDETTYETAFVVPTLADRVIYFEFFMNNKDIHKESFERANEWREKANKSPASFRKLANDERIPVNQLRVSRSRGVEVVENKQKFKDNSQNLNQAPEAVRNRFETERKHQAQEGIRWIEEIIVSLHPGEISQKIIDQQESWAVVKLIGKDSEDKTAFVVECAIFPKKDYQEWLDAEKQNVIVSNAVL